MQILEDMLRHRHHGLTIAGIAAATGSLTGTVSQFLGRARTAGIGRPLPDGMVCRELLAQSRRARRQLNGRAGLQMCEGQAEDFGQLPDGVRHRGLRHSAKFGRDRAEAGLECALRPAGQCGAADCTARRPRGPVPNSRRVPPPAEPNLGRTGTSASRHVRRADNSDQIHLSSYGCRGYYTA